MPGERARRVVSLAAPLSLVLAVAGAVAAVPAQGRDVSRRLLAGFVLLGLAAVVAVACYWHGARNEHERGRGFAAAAFLAAAGVLVLVLRDRHHRYGLF